MFKTIEDFFASPLMERMNALSSADVTDRVLKSTRLEQQIYNELHGEDETLSSLELQGAEKLKGFKSLTNDTFQSFYGITPRYNEDERLTTSARKLNKFILEDIMNSEDYGVIKSICEGKELPSMEATVEFTDTLLPRLDELLTAASGQKDSLNVLEKLEEQRDTLLEQLSELVEQRNLGQNDPETEQQIIKIANKAESKAGQADTLNKMVDRNLNKNADAVREIVHNSISAAKGQAEFTKNVIVAWGDGDAEMKRTQANMELLKRINTPKLKAITMFLGQYKEIICQARKNGYAFGLGEKYDIEYGNNVNKALTSELALLASPDTIPLFLRKVQSKRIKQYRRREPISKGRGDMIICLDESGSVGIELDAWGKAIALAMLDICRQNRRNLALVHFSSTIKTDIFRHDDKDFLERLIEASETFLGGGTDYTNPLDEAVDMIENGVLDKPDVVFITDGACEISEEFKIWLEEKKKALKFTITGILLDNGNSFEFSLQDFCDTIHRTSELTIGEIAEKLIQNKI